MDEIENLVGERGLATYSKVVEHADTMRRYFTATHKVDYEVVKYLPPKILHKIYNDKSNKSLLVLKKLQEAPSPTTVKDGLASSVEQLTNAVGALVKAQTKGITKDEVVSLIDKLLRDRLPTEISISLPDAPKFELEAEPRHKAFKEICTAVAAGVNVLLVGPAGCGKTFMAEQIARSLKLDFHFTGAVASEYKLLGFIDAHGRTVDTEYRRAYENGGLFLWDELDASSAGALLAFNSGLANEYQDFPDKTVARHKNFRTVASANTFGNGADRQYVGRNQLDAASIDRFYVVPIDYDEQLEKLLYGEDEWVEYVHRARAAVKRLAIRHVISMRAIDQGRRMLQCNIARNLVERGALWRSLSDGDIKKIKNEM